MVNSLAAVSGFRVGSALLAQSGKVYTGVNIENPSLTLVICAERVALYKALSEGERGFRAIAVTSSQSNPCYPCGLCRQALYEFAPEMEIVVDSGGSPEVRTLRSLLPEPFTL